MEFVEQAVQSSRSGSWADLAVLSGDYEVIEEEIMSIESTITLVGGEAVHAAVEFAKTGPPPLPR
jgi:predicted amidohydrolase YtcJ